MLTLFLFPFSTMKLTNRGFTLVELLVIIAIIWILIAALYPSLLNYIIRGRDTQRITALKDVLSATINYQTDNDALPIGTSSLSGSVPNCVNPTALNKYLVKFPYDPNKNSSISCWQPGLYWYWTWLLDWSPIIILSVVLENENAGNTYTGITAYQWNWLSGTIIRWIDTLVKWAGSGYIIRY